MNHLELTEDQIRSLFAVSMHQTMRDVINCIERNAAGLALVIEDDLSLVDVLTDGDVRRAILSNLGSDDTVEKLLEAKRSFSSNPPIVSGVGMPPSYLLHIMRERRLRHIPLVDSNNRVSGLALLSELSEESQELTISAVIMAGGFGMRLRPLTNDTPKPMLPVGGRPLLERIVRQLAGEGIRQFYITTHYQADVIKSHFGNGQKFGIKITYIDEEEPLGTAGALGLLPSGIGDTLLVVNADILSSVDFKAMFFHHFDQQAQMSVGVRKYEMAVPYGVVQCNENSHVEKLEEKPSLSVFINAGIYLIQPTAMEYLPKGGAVDMPDLIQTLIDQKEVVASFPIHEYWMDIGKPDDYARAHKDIETGAIK